MFHTPPSLPHETFISEQCKALSLSACSLCQVKVLWQPVAWYEMHVKPLPPPLTATCLLLAGHRAPKFMCTTWQQGMPNWRPPWSAWRATALASQSPGQQPTASLSSLLNQNLHKIYTKIIQKAYKKYTKITKKRYKNYAKITQKLHNSLQYHQSMSYNTQHRDSTFSVMLMWCQ